MMARLKSYLPFDANSDNDLFLAMFLAMFLMRLPPTVRETV